MREHGISPLGEEYCICGCGAYDMDLCGRIDCPHSETCREIGQQNK